METFECCNLLKNYLLDAKKNLLENAKKEDCIQRIQQGDNLTDFKEVFAIVLKNVEVLNNKNKIEIRLKEHIISNHLIMLIK